MTCLSDEETQVLGEESEAFLMRRIKKSEIPGEQENSIVGVVPECV